jgi:flagellar biosynthesis protein FlhG
MVSHRRDGQRVHARIAETAGRFLGLSVGMLGSVFCDGHVGKAVQRQEPLLLAFPHSQAAWCIKQLSRAVLEGLEAPPRGHFGFFRRVANLFTTARR